MTGLYPNDDRSYDIYWIWNPLNQLRRARRRVQWAGQSDYQPVDADIVSEIRLLTEDGEREAVGGKLQVFIGWDIDEWQLTPTTFRVEKP